MLRQDVKIASAGGGKFDCYVVTPDGGGTTSAIVLASAIHGADKDLRAIAEEFAGHGYIAAAPDLFWRTDPGARARGDPRAPARAHPRLEKIKAGEPDLADVLTHLGKLPSFNGRAAVIGFCYGGPYAILGPRRLGYEVGIACHGSQMLDYLPELEGVRQPVCLIWGDQDHLAPADVRDAYRALPTRLDNVEVLILPNVRHGYMMRSSVVAFDEDAYAFSMGRALAMLHVLRNEVGLGGVES